MFVLLRLYVVFEASCRHSGLMFPWPPPDAVQRSDSFSRVVISACVVSSPTATGVEDGGIMATISEAKCSVIGNRERARPNGERGVLFLAFDPFFFLFFFFFFSEREADHAEVAELWSIGGEGVEEMGESLYFLHLKGDKEARKFQTLREMRINVSKNSISICAR